MVGLSVGLASLATTRFGSATLPDKLNSNQVLAQYMPQLEAAVKRCAAAVQNRRFGDVIVAVMPGEQPHFEIDVSRSLGREIAACVRARFRPILTTLLEGHRYLTSYAYDVVEVGPRRALPPVDPAFTRLWLRDGARLKTPLPAEASLESDGCLRLRGSDAYEAMVHAWLDREGTRVDPGWSDELERQFSIPHEHLMGAWLVQPRTVLLWSGDSWVMEPRRLCPAKLDETAVARLSGKPEHCVPRVDIGGQRSDVCDSNSETRR